MLSPGSDATVTEADPPMVVLAFDHRERNFSSVRPVGMSHDEIRAAKELIFDAFEALTRRGLRGVRPGIIVDEEFGASIARRAIANGVVVAMPVERASSTVFAFEHGDAFREHLRAFRPACAKALVRYRADDDPQVRTTQQARLRELSDFLSEEGIAFMLELLVGQGRRSTGGVPSVDATALCASMSELQDAGVRVDLWKVEGTGSLADAARIAGQAMQPDPRVRCVILGGGAPKEAVGHWLDVAAATPGFVGFAIGRNIWGESVAAWLDGTRTREQAIEEIASTCIGWALRYVGERI